jgi:hypothetical protein
MTRYLGMFTRKLSMSSSSLGIRSLCVLAVTVAAGCATLPSYTGTFAGHAERLELDTWDGKAFPVTAFTIETPKGRIRTGGCPRYSWTPESHPRVILVDACLTIYPPDKYAGKRLEVEGRITPGWAHPFPGGSALLGPPQPKPASGRLNYSVLIVRTVLVYDTATGRGEVVRGAEPHK